MNLRDDLAATIARAKAAGLTLHITVEDAERILRAYDEALALLRELNDALAIPERFQPRVDAVLDRADAGPDFNQERNAHADTIAAEYDSKKEDEPHIAAICELDGCCMLRDKPQPQEEKS